MLCIPYMKLAPQNNSQSLFSSQQGGGFVEKLIILGLFAFAVAAGLKAFAGGANATLQEQGAAIQAAGGGNGASTPAHQNPGPNIDSVSIASDRPDTNIERQLAQEAAAIEGSLP